MNGHDENYESNDGKNERKQKPMDGASVRWSCVVVVSVAFGWWQVNCILSLGEWRLCKNFGRYCKKKRQTVEKQWKAAVDKWFIGNFSWTLCSLQTFLCLVSAKTEKRIGRHFRSGIKMDGIKKSMSKWSFPLLFSSLHVSIVIGLRWCNRKSLSSWTMVISSYWFDTLKILQKWIQKYEIIFILVL